MVLKIHAMLFKVFVIQMSTPGALTICQALWEMLGYGTQHLGIKTGKSLLFWNLYSVGWRKANE